VRKQIQPKISELRRRYASREPELRRRVLERWVPPRGATSARVDLSGITAIRNAIVSEAGGADRWRPAAWSGEEEDAEEEKEWEVVRMIRGGLKELERRSQSSELLGGFRGTGDLVEKFKSSLVIPRTIWSQLFFSWNCYGQSVVQTIRENRSERNAPLYIFRSFEMVCALRNTRSQKLIELVVKV
jgi:hypothetical protein